VRELRARQLGEVLARDEQVARVGLIEPPIKLSNVVLPEPEGPISA
jgi:hypothetical protein